MREKRRVMKDFFLLLHFLFKVIVQKGLNLSMIKQMFENFILSHFYQIETLSRAKGDVDVMFLAIFC